MSQRMPREALLNFNNTLEKRAVTALVVEYGSPLAEINRLSREKQQMTSVSEFHD